MKPTLPSFSGHLIEFLTVITAFYSLSHQPYQRRLTDLYLIASAYFWATRECVGLLLGRYRLFQLHGLYCRHNYNEFIMMLLRLRHRLTKSQQALLETPADIRIRGRRCFRLNLLCSHLHNRRRIPHVQSETSHTGQITLDLISLPCLMCPTDHLDSLRTQFLRVIIRYSCNMACPSYPFGFGHLLDDECTVKHSAPFP